ncbi:hypothetical protein ABT298_34580, partial [Streptomyces sp. NPDC001034]
MTTTPATPAASALRAARRRDRRVYTRSHPLLFALLAATRRRTVVRVGGAVLVHGTGPYRQALTRIPLDRAAAGTTGGGRPGATATPPARPPPSAPPTPPTAPG